ncbi:MAG: YbaB/EbfC family nucleoid-associated protein [Spirochaetales bacterium]
MQGFGNIGQIMKQAQQMQEKMAKVQEELTTEEVTASVAGGMVEVTMTGKKKVTSIKLKEQAVDKDDIEMLEDLLVAAVNEASEKADELAKEKMTNAGLPSSSLQGLM